MIGGTGNGVGLCGFSHLNCCMARARPLDVTHGLQKHLREKAGYEYIKVSKMDLCVTASVLWQGGSCRHKGNSIIFISSMWHTDCMGIYKWELSGPLQILCFSLHFLSVLMLPDQLCPVLLLLTCDMAKPLTGLCRGANWQHSAFSNVVSCPVGLCRRRYSTLRLAILCHNTVTANSTVQYARFQFVVW